MNLGSKINKLEKVVNKKHSKKGLRIVEEYEGKYFIEKEGGQYIEVDKPVDDDPYRILVILKSYSDPTKPYEMQENIK